MEPLRVAVLGGLNMDLIVRVAHLPRPGETVSGDDLLRAPGGKGGNQAVAAARIGAIVSMLGRVGRDPFGHELSQSLRNHGVDTRWVQGSDRATGAALIVVDERGENSIAVAQGANADLVPEDVPRRLIDEMEVVVASLEVPLASIEAAFGLARRAGVRTVLNAAPAQSVPSPLLALSDVVICNEIELASLVGRPVSGSGELDTARSLSASLEQVVVVTLGPRGAVAVAGDETFEQPSFAVTVIDTVGAGDAFVGGFVCGRWWSAGLPEALRWGCAAGALATTKHGAQPSMPTLSDVQSLLAG